MTDQSSEHDSQEDVEQVTAADLNSGGDDSEDERPKGKTFSEDEVEQIVKKRLARDRRKRAKEQPQPQKREERPKSDDLDAADLHAEVQALRAERQLQDAIDDSGLKLSKKMRSRIRRMFEVERPDDASDWLEDMAEDLGIHSTDSSDDGESAKDTPEAKQQPVKDYGSVRRAPVDFDSVSDPGELTREDMEYMERKYGKKEANRKIRLMAENFYKGKNIALREER